MSSRFQVSPKSNKKATLNLKIQKIIPLWLNALPSSSTGSITPAAGQEAPWWMSSRAPPRQDRTRGHISRHYSSMKCFQIMCWVPVAHVCNPSYLGSWDQEGHSSRPASSRPSQPAAGYSVCLSSQLCRRLRSVRSWFQASCWGVGGVARLSVSRKELGMVTCTCHPSFEKTNLGGPLFSLATRKGKPYLQNNQSIKRPAGMVS
jgi:hypothetical protein